MGIESLKLRGFKTYAEEDKVVFANFTCVVGPNGVGKSNLVDAIAFALGADLADIRGSIYCRESQASPLVELCYRTTHGVLVTLRRELQHDCSSYFINAQKVTAKEYAAFLEAEGVSIRHRNFLISQNEALIRAPRDLSRFIDQLSGSAEYQAPYKRAKEQRDQLAKKCHELGERQKLASLDLKAHQDLQALLDQHRALTERQRTLAQLKLHQRTEQLSARQHAITQQLAALKREHPQLAEDSQLDRDAAQRQTELIKTRANQRALKGYLSLCLAQQESQLAQLEAERDRLRQKQAAAIERQSEAEARVAECRWQLQALEAAVQRQPTEQLDRELILKTVGAIQQVERAAGIAELKLQVAQAEQQLNELQQQLAAETTPERFSEPTSDQLAQLNRELLDVLRALSHQTAHRQDCDRSSQLAYHLSQLQQRMPQIIGRVDDLVTATDQRYATALHALLYPHRHTVVIDHEQNVLPILNGLVQIAGGRVTVLPLNRILARGNGPAAPAGYHSCLGIMRLVQPKGRAPLSRSEQDKLLQYLGGDTLLYLGEDTPRLTGVKLVTLDGVVISRAGELRRLVAPSASKEAKELELRRDVVLAAIKAEHARLKRAQKENAAPVPLSSPALQALAQQLAQRRQAVADAQRYVEEQTAQLLAGSQLSPEVVQQALAQGVCDRRTGERQLQQLRQRLQTWQHSHQQLTAQLDSLAGELAQTEAKLEETASRPVTPSTQEAIAQHERRIAEIEQELAALAAQQTTPAKIELRILQEQLLSLRDEREELEQYAAEEGFTGSPGVIVQEGQSVEEELDQVVKELAAVTQALRGKKASPESQAVHRRLEGEIEQTKEVLGTASKELVTLRRKRKELFLGVFDRLNALLNRHYSALTSSSFSHARAHLGLENSAEPYLGGTQVFVMPTGKTFREAKYLSGGERTMAALALLLSVHEIFPSPFYVVDELDAALDRDKIQALRQALGNIEAQFIAVTHRLELFETAETLVGIAKPPQGCSQVFTLRLAEDE